jgi:hypothetical protein
VESGKVFKVSLVTRRYQVAQLPAIIDKMAYLVQNPVTRVIVSFFLGLSRMSIPVGIFETREEAVQWLKQE